MPVATMAAVRSCARLRVINFNDKTPGVFHL
jgi:hypothetical protein